jgi:hypothetical protein
MPKRPFKQTDSIGGVQTCGCKCDAHGLECHVVTRYENPEMQLFVEQLQNITHHRFRHTKESQHYCYLCSMAVEANRPVDFFQIDPHDGQARPWMVIERDRRMREDLPLPTLEEYKQLADENGYDMAAFDDPEDLTFDLSGTESVMNPVEEDE